MKDSAGTVIFALCLAVVCSACLTAVNELTAPLREANEKAEKTRNILQVLGVPFGKNSPSNELLKIYERDVKIHNRDGMEFYTFDHPDVGRLWAIKFAGAGLWGPIEGLLCLKDDLKTIYAISFYKQEETPGLGGEIASKSFRDRFSGKKIISPDGKNYLRIVRGLAKGDSEVDAISGATLTCNKVQEMLDKLCARLTDKDTNNGR